MRQIRTGITAPVPVDVLVAEFGDFEAGKDVTGSPYYWPAKTGDGDPVTGTRSALPEPA